MEQDTNNKPNSSTESRKRKMLLKLYNVSTRFAEDHNSSNRGAVASFTSTLLDMELERMDNKEGKNSADVDGVRLDMDDSFSELSTTENSRSSHFVDRFMERLIKHAIPMDSIEKDILEKRLHDKERANKPKLSIKILASNFKTLSTKISVVFLVQYGLIRIITWKHPTKTLTALILYTALCIRPHFILIYPLLFFFMGVIIPAYLDKHPMKTPELIKVKKRGQSFFNYLNDSEDVSIADDLLTDTNHSDIGADSLYPVNSINSESSLYTPGLPPPIVGEKEVKVSKKERYAKSQVVLLMNMRDLQNLTTDLLQAMDDLEKFLTETAAFKNEKLTTFMSYGIILAILGIMFFGCYIPWRFIFISSAWLILTLCHPNAKKYIEDLKTAKKVNAFANEEKKKEDVKQNIQKIKNKKANQVPFDRSDIIISETKATRIVEIFELQVKNMVSNEWEFYMYSNTLFDYHNPERISGRKPKGVSKLENVTPPSTWKFESSSTEDWNIDKNPTVLFEKRSLNTSNTLSILENEENGWIYDNEDESKNWDNEYTFRRRRIFRNCFRY